MVLRDCGTGEQGGRTPSQILADQLTLFQPWGADYAHHITASPPGFQNPAAALPYVMFESKKKNQIFIEFLDGTKKDS